MLPLLADDRNMTWLFQQQLNVCQHLSAMLLLTSLATKHFCNVLSSQPVDSKQGASPRTSTWRPCCRNSCIAAPLQCANGCLMPITTLRTPACMRADKLVLSPWQSPVSRFKYAVDPEHCGCAAATACTSADVVPCAISTMVGLAWTAVLKPILRCKCVCSAQLSILVPVLLDMSQTGQTHQHVQERIQSSGAAVKHLQHEQ